MENEFMPKVDDPKCDEIEIDNNETNINLEIQENEIDEPVESEEIIEVEEKQLIPQENIFKDVPPPVIKKPRRTRKMTPAALESLAKAREKAKITRSKNKEARSKGEMIYPTEKKKIEKEVAEEKKRPVVNNIVHETKNITNNITHEDIEAIVQKSTQKTLEEYDNVRKARKIKKKKDNEVENQKTLVKNTILKAQGMTNTNFYSGCF